MTSLEDLTKEIDKLQQMVIESIKSECKTYREAETKLDAIQREATWQPTGSIKVAYVLIESVKETLNEEKNGLQINADRKS